jgi:hypothetical protein
MRAAIAGIAAVIVIAVAAGLVMSQLNPTAQHRFAIDSTTRL